jgi:hypothetical protein
MYPNPQPGPLPALGPEDPGSLTDIDSAAEAEVPDTVAAKAATDNTINERTIRFCMIPSLLR